MTVLSIVIVPDQILKNPCAMVDINEIDDLKTLVSDMIETLRSTSGIGLAAPQVGISKRIIVVENKENLENSETEGYTKTYPYVLINPTITFKSQEKEVGIEGCLSVPDLVGAVKRSIWISVSGFTIDGQIAIVEADGLMARVFQHEIQHLDGVLFIKKAIKVARINDEDKPIS